MISKRKVLLCFIDSLCFLAVYLCMMLISVVSSTAVVLNISEYIINFVILWSVGMLVRFAFRIYSNMWRYANSRAYLHMVISDAVSASVCVIITRFAGLYGLLLAYAYQTLCLPTA